MSLRQGILFVWISISLSFVGGCMRFGGNCSVTLDSLPEGCRAYLVTTVDWDEAGASRTSFGALNMENHRVGETPCKVPTRAYNYWYVVMKDGQKAMMEIRPRPEQENNYLLKLDE